MKKMKLDEVLVNAILNPDKKFRHESWLYDEYIYWFKGMGSHYFRDENGEPEDISDYSTLTHNWVEHKEI